MGRSPSCYLPCIDVAPVAGPDALDNTPTMPEAPLRTQSSSSLGASAASWDRLVMTQPLPSPFLRSWWLDHAAAATPVVLTCHQGDQLVGGAAFEVDRTGVGPLGIERVRALGQGVLAPDHLDLIAAPEHRRAVAREVWRWLRRPGSRIVDLDGLAATGTLAALLASHETDRTAAPFAAMPTGASDYLAARPGRLRSTVNRTAKRLDRAGVEMVDHRDTFEDGLAHLMALHDSRWEDDSVFLRGWERFAAAAHAGAAMGEVLIHELRDAAEGPVAVELGFRVGDRHAFYQAGRRTEHDWRGAGSVLRARVIESAAATGAVEYDLLRGDESYKSDWATDRRELVRCVMGVGPLGVAAVRARAERDRRRNRSGAAPTDDPVTP